MFHAAHLRPANAEGFIIGFNPDGTMTRNPPINSVWTWVNGEIPQEHPPGQVLMWKWHVAPGELQYLCDCGGDEDFVLIAHKDEDIPWQLNSRDEGKRVVLPDGRIAVVWSHA
jgi:hypothetical protein